MKLVVFGASGRTGTLLVWQALDAGHEVTAYIRPESTWSLEHPLLRIVKGNLNDATRLIEVLTGADACLAALGGRSMTRRLPELVAGMDLIISVMEQVGVSRLIYLSSIGAGDSRYYMGPLIRMFIVWILLRAPLADHTAIEKRIRKSGLKWTIVRPMGLSMEPGSGNIRHGDGFIKINSGKQIPRVDVAAFLLKQVDSGEYENRAVWLQKS
jgi:putative NADH-flavin reductase